MSGPSRKRSDSAPMRITYSDAASSDRATEEMTWSSARSNARYRGASSKLCWCEARRC